MLCLTTEQEESRVLRRGWLASLFLPDCSRSGRGALPQEVACEVILLRYPSHPFVLQHRFMYVSLFGVRVRSRRSRPDR